ncbi:glycosyltransferase family 2 protein [Pararobbsia silviterrae]|uniref:Glycosyltransferase n=1 Tax=Pararobbsia silviterrae TaxID=1792498 RepID=A0A494Y1L7_9BURK|nr:glycosyltransferase family 2 protein [Pararobbsia silviterrae]RKP55898.1 glycosyltransferase [Pararobbsia silviterrae]
MNPTPLETALAAASPRLTPRPTTWISVLIHGSVMVLWILLFARAFFLKGTLAWSAGIVYIGYDTVLLVFVTIQSLPLLRRVPPDVVATPGVAPSARVTLGVIVAAYNEASVLPVTLDALFEQDDAPDEIVIADDGSTDATAALLAERYGLERAPDGEIGAPSPTHPTLRWLRVAHGGKARALNAAIGAMRSDTLMTVDADTLLAPGACRAMRHAFATETYLVSAAGILTPLCGHTREGRFFQWFQTYEYIRNFISRYAWMRAESLLLISGAFACFRRDALVEVGGFDPECLVEDYELIHRLRRFSVDHARGWTVRVIGAAQAFTDAPSTLASFLRQRRRWFAGFLQTQYWNRDMAGDRRYGAVGLLMLPIKAIDTVQPIYGLTAFALLLGFLFTGEYSALVPALGFIVGKIAIDLAFHVWSVYLYRRWTRNTTTSNLGMALLAAITEPFSFQLLRHTGATLGWFQFALGRKTWGVQHRAGVLGQRARRRRVD